MNNENEEDQAKESLESSLELPAAETTNVSPEPSSPPSQESPKKNHPFSKIGGGLFRHVSIYLPIFVLFLVAVVISAVLLYRHEHPKAPPIAEQTLSPQALSNLANNNQVVGNSNEVLTVQSSSIFGGQVLIKGQLQVAGQLSVGGSLNLSGITVSGNSVLSQLQVNKNLAVSGNASVQGTLAVQNDLSVNGTGTFSGLLSAPQLSVNTLQLAGDLTLSKHLITTGSIPGHASGSAIGSGGTSSVSGSDSAGEVTISTGSGVAAGCYITVNFSSLYSSNPHVLLTPVGAAAATLQYYVNRNTSSFSVCSANSPQSGETYTYDYFVVD